MAPPRTDTASAPAAANNLAAVRLRLRRAGVRGVTLLEPTTTHYYQPLWTLVGGGQVDIRRTGRPQESLIPPTDTCDTRSKPTTTSPTSSTRSDPLPHATKPLDRGVLTEPAEPHPFAANARVAHRVAIQ